MEQSLSHEKTMAALSACFGLVALALTCIGVYGVVSYAVKARTHEIGIRLALGAGGRHIAAMLVKSIALPVSASLLLGGIAAILLGPAIRNQLFGIGAHDYSMLLASAVLIAGIAGLAGYIPARRAADLDPTEALRDN